MKRFNRTKIPWGWAIGSFAAGYLFCKMGGLGGLGALAPGSGAAPAPGGISSPTPGGGYALAPTPSNYGQLMSPTGTLSQGAGAGGAVTVNAGIPFGGGSSRGQINLSGFGFF